ncbi:uncharacterized protein LOC129966271 [Argiope bruennichi]|uniref:uncharacterized protein LOC129966271 n=1 Tax=Argiope bruennichi TaxID=94029 RepID=UPI00249594B7|nr:uncharacterized protein LOC129966271 [Argiope bruennichi]
MSTVLIHIPFPVCKWNTVIWSDKSSFILFLKSGRVHAWNTLAQAYDRNCLLPPVRYESGSVMLWVAISWISVGPIITLKGRIAAEKYREVLGDQVHPIMLTLFAALDWIFQDDNALIHGAGLVWSSVDENEDKMKCLPWAVQSPLHLHINESLWSILKCSIRNRYHLPTSRPKFSDISIKNGTISL